MTTNKIKVLIADDHEIFRDGVKQLICNEQDMEVVATASNGEEALEQVKRTNPDVVILDIRMPGPNGLETSRQMLSSNPGVHILFFSLYDREDYVVTALETGAHGYILKDASNKIFLKGIRAVAAGQYFFTGEVSDIVVKNYKKIREEKHTGDHAENSPALSRREQEIVEMIKAGKTNKEMAEEFGLSVRTVEAHRLNILRKFNSSSFDDVLKTTGV
jgi:two-component system, NarL family, response regulator DegU